VQVVTGRGAFASPQRLDVETEGGRVAIAFEHAIVAAGSRTVKLPGLPDDPRVLDSTSALALADVPARLLVIGGGIIGLELATVYAALGSEVTIVEALDRLMPGPDADLVRPLEKRLTPRCAGIHLRTKVSEIAARADGLHVRFEGESPPARDVFDRVLVAVGRRPNGDAIGADAAGLRVDERGFVPVDARMATNLPHVFAIGDVARAPLLAHKAMHEGKAAAEAACGEKAAFDARVIPGVAYTDPEVAWVGLGEAEARAAGRDVEVARFPWLASGRALGMDRAEGMTKLVYAKDTQRILGAGIVGPHAGDLIAECALAIEMGADVHDVALTVHPHPTLAETIGLAAEVAAGTVTDLAPPRRR
jgi:dihydrolipoamide dehydrogenase